MIAPIIPAMNHATNPLPAPRAIAPAPIPAINAPIFPFDELRKL